MFKELAISVKLTRATVRTIGLIDMLNTMAPHGAIMYVRHFEPVSNTAIKARLSLSLIDNEILFSVLSPSSANIVNLVSRYNMANAQGCGITFFLKDDSFLEIRFTAPNELVAKEIQKFFSLTNA